MRATFGEAPPRRKPNLTPMIDVVFLLLVFFMLASRFGTDMFVPLKVAGGGSGYSGPPRLVDVLPEGVTLNGVAIAEEDLVTRLEPLTESPEDTIILRPRDEAELQRVIDVMDILRTGGMTRFVLLD